MQSWNEKLVNALRAKAREQQAKNAANWFYWQRATEAVEAVRKDIKLTRTGAD